MSKRISRNKTQNPSKIINSQDVKGVAGDGIRFENNAASAAFFPGMSPFGGFGSEQLSETTTIEKNLRYYMLSNFRQTLSWAFLEIGLIQTICTIPIEDALRGGLDIKTKELDGQDIEDLIGWMEENNDLQTASEAGIWNRLYGGSGLIIVTDQDPAKEFDIEEVTQDSKLSFIAADLWELFWAQINTAGNTEVFSQNDKFKESDVFSYYGYDVNKSRVMTMRGIPAPSFLRPSLRGWGCSVVESLVRSINQYLKTNDLIFEVLDEFKLDVYRLKNLTNTLLQKDGVEKIQRRVQFANLQKNYQNALVMDSEDEHSSKELSFTGVAEVMEGIRMQVASDLRMPLTKLFGTSAQGFASGADDIENYNAMIESSVRAKMKFHLLRMVKLRCKQKFGFIPDDLSISFKPLRVLSSEQEENVKNAKFTRLLQARQSGECTAEEFKEGCNVADLLPIQLDTTIDTINMSEYTEANDTTLTGADMRLKEPKQQPKHSTPKLKED